MLTTTNGPSVLQEDVGDVDGREVGEVIFGDYVMKLKARSETIMSTGRGLFVRD